MTTTLQLLQEQVYSRYLNKIGSFGRVRLARNKKTGDYYAMKILKKQDIIKLKQVDHVISENTILADIDHPFLVRMSFYIDIVGRIEGICIRPEILVFPDGLHPWRRIIHIPENRGQIDIRALPVSFTKISHSIIGSTHPRCA